MIRTKRLLATVIAVILFATIADSKPRDKRQMQEIAKQAIMTAGRSFAPKKGAATTLQTVKSCDNISIIGFENGAYAVVSNDDELPEVLGISTTPYSEGRNKNLEWWLQATDKVMSEALRRGVSMKVTTPDPSKYPTKVDPLVTTKWDQTTPYNDLLPEGIYTGCVATAMAQVLNYHKSPSHGIGTASVLITCKGYSNYRLTANFAEDFYDWDNMLDEYNMLQYSNEEANAVALLMRDCGVAAKMQYGGDYEGGSGAYLPDAAEGLRKYFGFEKAEYLAREDFSESAWMNRIYKEISTRGPIIYGGADYSLWAGHAFVLHGYRSDGKVYVNWGWSGDDDGWYDVATLMMPGYSFSAEQDMIVGIEPYNKDLQEVTVELTAAGELESKLPEDALHKVGKLTVAGNINSTDLRLIRTLAGIDHEQNRTEGVLNSLDLTSATIVSGGEPYLIDGQTELTTADNTLPERALYGCISLREISLPANIENIGNGALAAMPGLTKVVITANDNQTFDFDDNFIYQDKTRKVVTNLIQTKSDDIILPDEVEAIAPYALSGTRISSLRMGKKMALLDTSALQNCSRLHSIRITSADLVPSVRENSLSGINYVDCKLYVPSGMKQIYKTAEGWKNFKGTVYYSEFDNIIEYGTLISVRNAIREYGDNNPSFGYVISGDVPFGAPVLHCDATPSSPAGEYIISIERGTLEGEFIELQSGTLYVEPATLTVELDGEYSREVGKADPEFNFNISGYKLDDDESVIIEMPKAIANVPENEEPDTYEVIITGGETNGNYVFDYRNGTITILPSTNGINDIDRNSTDAVITTISGMRIEIAGGNDKLSNLPKGIYIVRKKKIAVK